MYLERNRQSEATKQSKRLSRELQPEVFACIQADMQLRNPAFSMELFEKILRAPQVCQLFQQHTLDREACG